MSKERNELYEFGPFVLNVDERRLERAGGKSNGSLTDKAFQTLCILVRNQGHLITKQELLDQVWPDSFVEENNLDKCIHAIRQALHETPRQKYIETVVKHGYRFVADVRLISANGDNVQSEATDQARKTAAVNASHEAGLSPAAKKRIKTLAMIIGIFVFCASAVGYYMFRTRTSASGAVRSIAVLPIKPINSTTRDELYEIGTADSLINRLSLVKGLVVRPLSSVRKYTDIGQDPLAAGREQKVDYVLDSNYQLADGEFRITSRLINVATGEVEETYKTENDASKIFAVQDAVAAEFGNKLLARFGGKQGSKLAKRGTDNEEAYRLYLQGMFLNDKRVPEKLLKAIQSFEQAVRLDPGYALAWAGKAHSHRAVTLYGRDFDNHEEYKKSMEAINKALELDPDLSQAYSALCESKFTYEWDFAGAEQACKRAIELNPDSSLAHQTYARFLSGRGRFEEGTSEIKTAIDLEPASLYNQQVYGMHLLLARRYEEAVAQFKRAITMDEDLQRNHNFLSMTLALSGKESEAFEVWITSPRFQKKHKDAVPVFQTAFQTNGGWQGVMRERLNRFEQGGDETLYYLAAAWAGLVGDKDKAFEYLERSYQQREWAMHWLKVDPRLDPLRDDARFDDLVRRIETKDLTR